LARTVTRGRSDVDPRSTSVCLIFHEEASDLLETSVEEARDVRETSADVDSAGRTQHVTDGTPGLRYLYKVNSSKKVKLSHTRYRALGPELIPVYRQSARR